MQFPTLYKLLRSMLRWFARHDVETIEQRTRTRYEGLGVRAQALKRDTQRAVATWVLIYYDLGFNLEIWIDNLQFIDGAEPAKKQNRLSTHAVNVVRKEWNNTYVPTGGRVRRSRRQPVFSDEGTFLAAYTTADESINIFDTAVRLLVAPSVETEYFSHFHRNISMRDKRDAEILVAMGAKRASIPFIYPHLRLNDWDTVDELLSNPDVPKQLLYPPDAIPWERLFTIVSRYRLGVPGFIVFHQGGG